MNSDEKLDKELRFHLEEHAADLMARGVPAGEAMRQARIAIGGPEQVKEACRDVRPTRWLDDLRQDTAYALRTLRRKRGFAAATLAILALGIGVTTVMFTLVDRILLEPLPYPDSHRLVEVVAHSSQSRYAEQNLANADSRELRQRSRTLDLAGWVYNAATLSDPGEAEYEQQYFEISDNLFRVLGVQLHRGRTFLPEEDKIGGAPVAILGYSLWQRRFAGDPSAVGATLVLDGKRYTIVGIAPPDFHLDGEGDVYTPLGQDTAPYLQGRKAHPVRGLGRLLPGMTLAQAQSEISLFGRALADQYPDTNKGVDLRVSTLQPDVQEVQSTLWLLLGAVTLVLLVACVNVASLMLARAVSRERELAMRVALGANRWRLVRQCLTESVLLGVGGGALGLSLAAVGLRPFMALWPGDLPRAAEVHLNWGVLTFTAAVSLCSALIFGLAPALRVPASSVERALRAGARGATGGSSRMHAGLVVAEIALALMLLVPAGMLGRTLIRLSALDPGVDVRNVLVAHMALSPAVLTNPARIRAAWDDVLERARRVPGVESASIVDTVPLRTGHNENGYWTSAAVPPENEQPVAISTCVSTEYFSVMGMPLRRGRVFTDQDRMGSRRVIVIDNVLAQNAFPNQEAVGRQLWIPDMGAEPLLVVGVVGHVRYWGLAGDDQSRVRAQFYYPFTQVPDQWLRRWSELMSIAVRTSVPPLSLVQPLRHELRGPANDQVLYEVRTLEQLAASSLDRQRFLLFLFGVFAALAMLLACTGIYGVLTYLTRLRVPEFGVRMALGATAGDVRRLVLRQSLGIIVGGIAIGAVGALVANRLLESMVEGMERTHLETFLLMTCLLAVAGLLATFLPAQRAAHIDPMQALRED